jgi:Glycosyl hydrolase catalytic core
VHKRIALIAATVLAVAGLAVPAAGASRHMLIGFNDEANTLYGDAETTFPIMQQLHTQVLRVNLYWGGTPFAVANSKPSVATDPGDPAYDWSAYDRLVRFASQYKIKVVFSIVFTPKWANGGKARYIAPNSTANFNALRNFAYAAAKRYSGTYTAPVAQQDPNNATSALPLPAVRYWTAWNEPNNPVFLRPQWSRVGGRAVVVSARNYVKICNAVYTGVHKTLLSGEKVACGVTAPRGNNMVNSSRSSTDPYSFMRALKADGLRKFDVYAHHPYYQFRNETPTTPPRARTAATMGVLPKFMAQLNKLWPGKHLWITEYGYQTPPERTFAVSLKNQAKYLTQAFAIARRNPKIDMMLWFLVKDDPSLGGWQSGVMSASGKHKPSFTAFLKLPH